MPQSDKEDRFHMKKVVRIHRDRVHSIDMQGERFASASWDGTVKVYDVTREETQHTLGALKNRWGDYPDPRRPGTGPGDIMKGLYAVAFGRTQDHSHILGCVSGADDRGSVHLWNHRSGDRLLPPLRGHEGDVNAIDFHHTQGIMATASDDCTTKIWDIVEGHELRNLFVDEHEEAKEVYGAVFMGEELQYNLATCSFDGSVRIWDLRESTLVHELQHHRDEAIGIAFCTRKNLLATGGDDGLINLYDLRNNYQLVQQIETREKHKDCEVKRLAFDPSGGLLAVGTSMGTVLVFDIGAAEQHVEHDAVQTSAPLAREIAYLDGHEECVFDVAWGTQQHGDRTKRVLVSASHDNTSRVWVER